MLGIDCAVYCQHAAEVVNLVLEKLGECAGCFQPLPFSLFIDERHFDGVASFDAGENIGE